MIEIYWDDLKEKKQAEILELFGDNGNWDVFPLAVIPDPEMEQSETDTPSPTASMESPTM